MKNCRSVTLHHADVAAMMQSGTRYDMIILDVDNGPQALSQNSNHFLHSPKGCKPCGMAWPQMGKCCYGRVLNQRIFWKGLWIQVIRPAVSRKRLLAGKPLSITFTALLKRLMPNYLPKPNPNLLQLISYVVLPPTCYQ
ncbi:MAG: hypothetical protein IPP67_07240 [Rhodospirillaceae bacterium]|nr:hypothetical protein [Rhodospirillaceae bacterium]